jgi:hypothetical protein
MSLKREIKIDIIDGKYKCISAYKIPENVDMWLRCTNCNLIPLIWEFNNGRSTACGCGENQYNHFSIVSESIISYVTRHDGSALGYSSDQLRINWNHWVETGEELETHRGLREQNKW